MCESDHRFLIAESNDEYTWGSIRPFSLASYMLEICLNINFKKEQLQANQILAHCYLKLHRHGKSEIDGF